VAIAAATLSIGAAQAAAALSIGGAHGSARVLHNTADGQTYDALPPFAATPKAIPLGPVQPAQSAAEPAASSLAPAATSAVASLPNDLSVSPTSIPTGVVAAYVHAAKRADHTDAECRLRWQSLAGIGFVESDNALSGGSANPDWNGIAFPPILGPVLNGTDGFAAVPDTDHGALDGDPVWDRAVGPMQFLPSTWARYAADGDHDGVANPQDISDATLAAANYLCATGPDLNRPQPLIRAIYAYNHSYAYVRAVLTVAAHYENINPAALGVNGLPGRRPRRPGARSTGSPATSAGSAPAASPSTTPTPATTTGPSSSASPSTPPTGSPAPTQVATTRAGRPQPPRG
jgi:Transglycosylase SLT domain